MNETDKRADLRDLLVMHDLSDRRPNQGYVGTSALRTLLKRRTKFYLINEHRADAI